MYVFTISTALNTSSYIGLKIRKKSIATPLAKTHLTLRIPAQKLL